MCLIGRHVQSGIDDITSDDRWALYLDKLSETIWLGGKLGKDSEKLKTEKEKAQTRKEAAQALMDAFPGTLSFTFFRILQNVNIPLCTDQVTENLSDSFVLKTILRK